MTVNYIIKRDVKGVKSWREAVDSTAVSVSAAPTCMYWTMMTLVTMGMC